MSSQVRRQDAVQQLENSIEGQFGSSAAEDAVLLLADGPTDVASILSGAITGNDGTSSSKRNKRQIPIQGDLGDFLATEIVGKLPKKQ